MAISVRVTSREFNYLFVDGGYDDNEMVWCDFPFSREALPPGPFNSRLFGEMYFKRTRCTGGFLCVSFSLRVVCG